MTVRTPTSISGRVGRFASLNLARHLWLIAISLVATPVLYHGLGETAYGILAVVNLLAAQLAVLEMGFGHATIRWLARARGEGNPASTGRILGTSFHVFLATAVVGALILLLGRDFLVERYFQIPVEARPTAHLALGIGALFFAASIFGNLASAAWEGFQRFDLLNLIAVVAATLQIAGSVGLVLLGFGVVHVVAWSTFLGVGVLAVHAVGIRREVGGGGVSLRLHRDTFREMAGFGLILMVVGLLTQVYFTTGSLVLGHYVVVGALPFFTVPLGILQRLNQLSRSISSALYPLVSEMDGKADHVTMDRVFRSGTRTLVLAGVAGGLPALLLAGPFLGVWMGPAFAAEATPVLERFFLSFVLVLGTVPAVELARGAGRPGRLAVYVGILAAVNLAGVLALAPSRGVVGAADAFLGAQALGSVVLVGWVGGRAALGVFTLPLLGTVAAMGGLTAVLHASTRGLPARGAASVGVAVLTVAVAWFWVLSDDERNVVGRVLGGVGGRG